MRGGTTLRAITGVLSVLLLAGCASGGHTYASLSGHAQRTVAGPLTCGVSAPSVVYSAAQRASLGLTVWPDTQPGFYGTGGMTATGNAGGTGAIQQQQFTTKGQSVLAKKPILNVPTNKGYDYAGGGPLTLVNGLYLQTIHLENPLVSGSPVPFYTTVGLGLFNSATRQTTYLGAVMTPQETLTEAKADPRWTINIDTPNIINLGDGYLYLMSTDWVHTPQGPVAHSLISVRAPLADVVAAAQAGHVSPWYKYKGGDWTSPALGGASDDIETGQPFNWQPNAYVDTAHSTILVVSPTSQEDIVVSMNLATGGWSTQQTLFSDPGKFIAYPTLHLESGVLKLYYLQWQSPAQDWSTAQELVRTLTCT